MMLLPLHVFVGFIGMSEAATAHATRKRTLRPTTWRCREFRRATVRMTGDVRAFVRLHGTMTMADALFVTMTS